MTNPLNDSYKIRRLGGCPRCEPKAKLYGCGFKNVSLHAPKLSKL